MVVVLGGNPSIPMISHVNESLNAHDEDRCCPCSEKQMHASFWDMCDHVRKCKEMRNATRGYFGGLGGFSKKFCQMRCVEGASWVLTG